MKKYVAMVLTCSLLLSLLSISVGATNAFCAEEMTSTTDGSFYETYWILENGEFHQISEETYLELLVPQYYSFSKQDTGGTPVPMYMVSEYYTPKSAYTYYASATPVSPWSYYPAIPIVASFVTTYAIHSKTVSAEVKAKIRNAVTVKLGVTVAESSVSGTGNLAGSVGPAKPGMYARVLFQPKMASISGTVKKITSYNNGQRVENFDVTSKYPVTLANGLTDGIYRIQYSSKPL